MKKASIVLLFCLFIVLSFSARAQSNCIYTLSTNSYNALATGGNGSISITTQSNCSWTAATSDSWITLLNANGSGSGTISFSVAPNPGSNRMGFITVAGHFIRIVQLRFCPLSLPISNTVISSNGGTGGFVVVTPTFGCDVYLLSRYTWLRAKGGSSDESNSRTIFFAVDANSGGERQGAIIVSNHDQSINFEFTITQTASPCEYSITPTSIQVPSSGGTTSFNVFTQNYCEWSIQSVPSWITVEVGGGTRTGSGSVTLSVQPNNGAARVGTITAGGQAFTVNQSAAAPVELITGIAVVVSNNGKSIGGAVVTITDSSTGETKTVVSNPFGYVRFPNIKRGQTYNVTVRHKKYTFENRSITYQSSDFTFVFTARP